MSFDDYEDPQFNNQRDSFKTHSRVRREKPTRTRPPKRVQVTGIHHRRRKHFSW